MQKNYFVLFLWKNCIRSLISFLFLVTTSCSANEQKNTNEKQLFDSYNTWLAQLQKDNDIKGMAVALFDNEKIIWSYENGYCDDGEEKKVNSETVFNIQSMSKTITTTAVLIAVQKGLIDLDKPNTNYLPGFTVNSCFEKNPQNKITMRALLSCTAGFTHETAIGNNYDPFFKSYEEHCKSISDTWLKFPVGTKYSYSNLGFDLAAYIIEKVSKLSYVEFLEKELFLPLEMNFTTIDSIRIMNNQNRAFGNTFGIKSQPAIMPFLGSGAVYTNITDLVKFVQLHLNLGRKNNQQFISKDLLLEMYKPVIDNYNDYALGIAITKEGDSYAYTHSGSGFGFGSTMKWYPEYNIGVLILTNNDFNDAVYNTASKIAAEYIKQNSIGRDTTHTNFNPLVCFEKLRTKKANMEITNHFQLKGDSLFKSEWNKYIDTYELKVGDGFKFKWYASLARFFGFKKQKVEVFEKNNFLFLKYYDGSTYHEEQKLIEHFPGLFFTQDGETLDFRKVPTRYRNIELVR